MSAWDTVSSSGLHPMKSARCGDGAEVAVEGRGKEGGREDGGQNRQDRCNRQTHQTLTPS